MIALRLNLVSLFILVVAVCAGLIADFVIVKVSEQDQFSLMRHRVLDTAKELSAQIMDSQTMGMALLLGINEPVLKKAALGELPLDAPEVLDRIAATKQLMHADGIYVINSKGLVVAHDTNRVSFTGKNLAFRSYWQRAMSGQSNIYAAVGINTDERGLFVTAPLHATAKPDSAIIGVVVIKLLADYLDNMLAAFGSQVVLLSPQSVVFASSVKEWLYRMGEDPIPAKVADIVQLKQFGRLFGKSTVSRLPIALDRDFSELDGVRYAIVQGDIDWNDPAGLWKLVLLQDTRSWLPLHQRLVVDMLTGIGFFLLLAFVWLRHKSRAELMAVHRELEIHANQLEQTVAVRTQELIGSNAELARAKEQAEASALAKGNFLANMSHEIRTPMNAVIGLTDLALRTELSAKTRDYLLKIENASRSLLRIINDILDFSKIESGKLGLESIDFNLGRLFDHLADLFRNTVAEKNLELTMQIAAHCPMTLHADSLRIEQIATTP